MTFCPRGLIQVGGGEINIYRQSWRSSFAFLIAVLGFIGHFIRANYLMVLLHIWWSTEKGVVYGFKFRSSSVNDQIISMQWLSFRFQWSVSSLWTFSITMTDRSLREWSGRVKCLASVLSICQWFISDQCPVRCMWSAFSISPTYWMAHFVHSMR